jgi:hypothetical protein
MLFCLVLYRAGFIPAVFAFLIWRYVPIHIPLSRVLTRSSLPGAIGMYALAIAVRHVGETLPEPVYALLSGLNSSTVGIVALAAVQLSENAIKDRLSRILIIFGACAGLCYNALWYFPVLMLCGGMATVVWDGLLGDYLRKTLRRIKRWIKAESTPPESNPHDSEMGVVSLPEREGSSAIQVSSSTPNLISSRGEMEESDTRDATARKYQNLTQESQFGPGHTIKVRTGLILVCCFFSKSIFE